MRAPLTIPFGGVTTDEPSGAAVAERVHLSIVVPVYRGARHLPNLIDALVDVRSRLNDNGGPVSLSEAIFVDDGAIDDSAEVLEGLQAEHSWVRVIHFSRNFGQHPATIAGILHTSGDWIATLDEDLQHPPVYLPELLAEAIESRSDVVYARPEGGPHESHLRDLSSRFIKSVVGKISGNPHVAKFNSFRMIRGSVARAAASVATQETYFDIALCWFTSRIGSRTLPLKDHRHISERKSGYTFGSLVRHARRLLLSSEIKILKLGALIGFGALIGSMILAVLTVVWKIASPEFFIDVRGWVSTIVAILFFGGLTSVLLGIALEFMSTILLQTQGKPTYLVIDRSKDRVLRQWLERRPTEP